MIKKLRIKLIGVCMISLFLVFLVILTTISAISYRTVVADADSTLAILAANGGLFPKNQDRPSGGSKADVPLKKGRSASPELPYESRYFSVLLDGDGVVISVDTGKIAAIDTSTAMEYATDVWKRGSTRGFLGNYRFTVSRIGESARVIFLDCGRSLSSFRSFVFIGICVFLCGMVAVFLLAILLSEYIIRPVSESYEKQKQFITDAGHELKTPLTVIDADTEILSMDYGDNEWLADIQSQTKRLAELTNDLILLSRLEEGDARFRMIPFPISDVVEETVRSFQAPAITQKKTLSIEIEPMLSFCGDEKTIRQLTCILLDNALKYSQEGGEISVSLKKCGRDIHLAVYNTTEFIAREHLPHLFDRFYRTDSSRNSQTGGHGLGLSIAAAAVSLHKGKITAQTDDGHSLKVTAVLPANCRSDGPRASG